MKNWVLGLFWSIQVFFSKILFRNFRNCAQLDLDLNQTGNVFLGPNGSGKTNILEGIHCLSLGKSQKGAKDQDMTQIDADYYRLMGYGYLENKADIQIEVIYERKSRKKTLKINGSTQKSLSLLIGKIGIVSFSPEDTIITTGSPSHRRKFLDVTLSQISRSYLKNLQDYQEVLKQRNSILKNNQRKQRIEKGISGQLLIWTEKLVQLGTQITIKRYEAIHEISQMAAEIYRKITNRRENLSIKYAPDIKTDVENSEKISQKFLQALKRNRDSEYKIGYTLSGPQRDDIEFYINEKELRKYGSQGQHRSVCIALRLAEAQLLTDKMGEKPIILLDDVFSELDIPRTNALMDMFEQFGQVFLATPREDDLRKCPEYFTIFRIKPECSILNNS
jgi:DNA replication and repair protein RecF